MLNFKYMHKYIDIDDKGTELLSQIPIFQCPYFFNNVKDL